MRNTYFYGLKAQSELKINLDFHENLRTPPKKLHKVLKRKEVRTYTERNMGNCIHKSSNNIGQPSTKNPVTKDHKTSVNSSDIPRLRLKTEDPTAQHQKFLKNSEPLRDYNTSRQNISESLLQRSSTVRNQEDFRQYQRQFDNLHDEGSSVRSRIRESEPENEQLEQIREQTLIVLKSSSYKKKPQKDFESHMEYLKAKYDQLYYENMELKLLNYIKQIRQRE